MKKNNAPFSLAVVLCLVFFSQGAIAQLNVVGVISTEYVGLQPSNYNIGSSSLSTSQVHCDFDVVKMSNKIMIGSLFVNSSGSGYHLPYQPPNFTISVDSMKLTYEYDYINEVDIVSVSQNGVFNNLTWNTDPIQRELLVKLTDGTFSLLTNTTTVAVKQSFMAVDSVTMELKNANAYLSDGTVLNLIQPTSNSGSLIEFSNLSRKYEELDTVINIEATFSNGTIDLSGIIDLKTFVNNKCLTNFDLEYSFDSIVFNTIASYTQPPTATAPQLLSGYENLVQDTFFHETLNWQIPPGATNFIYIRAFNPNSNILLRNIVLGNSNPLAISQNNESIFENLRVYPNPSNGIVNIDLNENLDKINLVNMQGKIVKQFNPLLKKLMVSDIKPGVYILDLRNESKRSFVRLIIQE